MTAFTTLIPPFFIKRMFRAEAEAAENELELQGQPSEGEVVREENVPGALG